MTDAEILIYMNLTYHDIENTIVSKVNENYFYQRRTTDLYDSQNEYTFEQSTATSLWFKKLLQVEIKRDPDQADFEKIDHENIQLFDSARDVLEKLTPWKGFYDLKDSSIFIYPTPDEDVGCGLRASGTVNLIDLNLTDVWEEFIFPDHSDLRQFIPMIAMWVKQYVYQARGLIDLKNDAKNEYELEKRKMIDYVSNRDNAPMVQILPNWDIYK